MVNLAPAPKCSRLSVASSVSAQISLTEASHMATPNSKGTGQPLHELRGRRGQRNEQAHGLWHLEELQVSPTTAGQS